MSGEIKPLLGVAFFIIVFIAALFLIAKLVLFISPRVLDIGCSGTLLLLVWISAIGGSRVEKRNGGHVIIFRWLGVLFVTFLFIVFYRFINTLDTMGQFGCGFALFVLILIIYDSKTPPPSIIGDDDDDYHASR
jgi:hypothetical protein